MKRLESLPFHNICVCNVGRLHDKHVSPFLLPKNYENYYIKMKDNKKVPIFHMVWTSPLSSKRLWNWFFLPKATTMAEVLHFEWNQPCYLGQFIGLESIHKLTQPYTDQHHRSYLANQNSLMHGGNSVQSEWGSCTVRANQPIILL